MREIAALPPRNLLSALGPGVVGALTVTLLHEGAREQLEHPPRMDVLGKRSLKRLLKLLGRSPAHGKRLHQQALVGELISNTLYYALVALGRPRRPYLRGAVLGLLAGVGAVVLPRYLGLGKRPSSEQPTTAMLTVTWYFLGGLEAAGATRALQIARS